MTTPFEPVRSTAGPLTRMSEEEYFRQLRRDIRERLRGGHGKTLRKVELIVYDVTNVAKSALPGASQNEAPILYAILGVLASFGEAIREELGR